MASAPAHLAGRVALVTGAGRGIGRGIAQALVAAGARVMAVARTESDLAALQAETGCAYTAVSLADEAGCRRAVEAARAQLGPISILVNNAGDADADDGRAWEVEPDDWRLKLAVNLDAPFHLTRLALPDMLAAGHGRIVNIASTAGLVGGAGHDGLRGLEARARRAHARRRHRRRRRRGDLQRDLPGLGANRTHRGIGGGVGGARGDYPAGRVVTIDEVASLVAYLASDAAAGISGEAIRVALGSTW